MFLIHLTVTVVTVRGMLTFLFFSLFHSTVTLCLQVSVLIIIPSLTSQPSDLYLSNTNTFHFCVLPKVSEIITQFYIYHWVWVLCIYIICEYFTLRLSSLWTVITCPSPTPTRSPGLQHVNPPICASSFCLFSVSDGNTSSSHSVSLLLSAPSPRHPVFDMNSSLCLGPVAFLSWSHLETNPNP